MAVAAATAVIAPVALLSAPAAFATETPTAETSPSAEAPSATPSAPAASESTPATAETAPATTSSSPAAPSSPATTPSTPATSPSATPAEPDDDEDEGDCEKAPLKVALKGFPEKIVAGSGWKNFKFTIKNTGKKNLKMVEVFTTATILADAEKDTDRLIEKYAHFEYRGEGGKWINDFKGSGFNNGIFLGQFPLDAGKKVSIDLRVKIDKGAPTGDGLAIAAGGYQKGDTCYDNGDVYPFQVLAAGSNPGDVDDAEPNGDKPADVKPQGEAKELPVSGNLATTGSSSMLPTIGIAGGIAIVAGAGVVFAMKRRRSGDATA
ncbi:LPXTG cell wall anchor domain-containing protein [Streptomyces sp. NPDC023998]|uniref:LPXTG cell wall anchor domain-containing protein n=1 Tax=Streptomyces sp. NPDC023998 TaxID=3154597 RepID=UPI0033E66546